MLHSHVAQSIPYIMLHRVYRTSCCILYTNILMFNVGSIFFCVNECSILLCCIIYAHLELMNAPFSCVNVCSHFSCVVQCMLHSLVLKVKVVLYSAVSSPLDRSQAQRFTLFALPGRPVHSDINSASPGSILVMQQLRATTKSLTCPPLSIARYSFIQLSQLGHQWRERKCPIFETVPKGDSNPEFT